MHIGILESEDFSRKALNDLATIGDVELFNNVDLERFLSNKEVLFIRLKYCLDKDFLDRAKVLKYICTPTTGLNHIDLDECEKRGVEVVSLKDEYQFLSTIRATPEHTFGLILSLLRNYKSAFLSQTNNRWDREQYKGFELYRNSVGIIGFGRVGKILSRYLKAFDAQVYFYDSDRSMKSTNNANTTSSIYELIKKSNIVILSASYCRDNYQFFNSECIDLLKDKYFINTSRGELVDEKYLISKIRKDYFKGVAIDVIQDEQLEGGDLRAILELTNNRNFIVTPHISGATYDSMRRTEEFIFSKLLYRLKVRQGQPPS